MRISKGTYLPSLGWSACTMLVNGLLKSVSLAWLFHPRTLIQFFCPLRWFTFLAFQLLYGRRYLCISYYFNGWSEVMRLKILGTASYASCKCLEPFDSGHPEVNRLFYLMFMHIFMWEGVMPPTCLPKKATPLLCVFASPIVMCY